VSTAGAPLDDRAPRDPDLATPSQVPHTDQPAPEALVTSPTRTGPHTPAVVHGLVLVAVAVLVGLAVLTGVTVDLGLVVPLLVVALGVLLVAGGVTAGLRRRG
jgi:hypothetical protein